MTLASCGTYTIVCSTKILNICVYFFFYLVQEKNYTTVLFTYYIKTTCLRNYHHQKYLFKYKLLACLNLHKSGD